MAVKGLKTRTRRPIQQYNVSSPYERIAVDVVGFFLAIENGNKYIMVDSNYFSK